MYLKSLELVGFKSFANKTTLEFEPGMTSIVGPNGCGKSNISDSVRWVLGEQSAKALRGSKMEDCIFNGTDDRKPLGMAEVSITFANCEKTLGTEHNEVEVTRRVFRSGEGQYFINKTPSRLKDIQRLFMDTGIGTTSYSLMEQGQIDQILSSHPEDRRTIFEEASGITKFKTDKKEAIRKLEHTESNLLRLADVIREVKRQIGSLQRQAGKAHRYKALREELRKLDVYATKERVKSIAQEIRMFEAKISATNNKILVVKTEIEELEKGVAVLRKSTLQTEQEKGTILKQGVEAQSKLDHTRELIDMNRQRIEEYRSWSEREANQIDKTRKQIEEQHRILSELLSRIEKARTERDNAEKELKYHNDNFAAHQQQLETIRREIQELRSESIELESLSSKLQNQLMQIESRGQSDTIQRERLFAEQAHLESIVKRYEKRQAQIQQMLQDLENNVTHCTSRLKKLEQQKTQKITEEDLAGSARPLLDDDCPIDTDSSRILSVIVSHIVADDEYRLALETALHAWLHALLIMARKEGELQIVSTETDQARDRLNTVTWELNNFNSQDDSVEGKRASVSQEINRTRDQREKNSKEIEIKTGKLHELESKHSALQSEVTKHSIRFAELKQEVEHLESRDETVKAHLEERETLARNDADTILSYKTNIEQLEESIENAEQQLASLEAAVTMNTSKSESLDKNRKKQGEELEELEKSLAEKRALMDELRNAKSDSELKHNENTIRRQNYFDRISSEYNVTTEQVMEEQEPEWEDEKPGMEALETNIAELRTKIEAMGPVNLVAIEEHQELQERYTFLTQQEEDLINAKEQLLEMIKKINRTTSEMFLTTFSAVNENFLAMFKKLFNGGSAKLVLVNEEDVLECGIEIIARPPGKRLQNISLLSGGERTLTAVALLFAIYMIKPSPFCLLDEIDAALDDSNIGRFVNILQDFLKQSQFIVITHNRQTIATANILYGITMSEKGISKIVSMKFKEHEEEAAQPQTVAK